LRGQGEIRVLGMEITERSMPLIRSKVGLVFQDPENQLFMPTVFDDVSFGPINMDWKKDEVQGAVNHALNEVDMLKAAHRSPHHLSVGEKKRVAIATVLSMKPEILVLDEPSGNLDPGHRRQLVRFLKELALTKIIATHDLELAAEVCPRIALMDGGRIAAVGKSDDILRDRDLLESHGL
jgi:cobalt/nickel transport system ATP-binding protein